MIFNSKIEKEGNLDIIDFRMSEKFGLEWKSYDSVRMQKMMAMMNFEAERQEKEFKKQYGGPKTTNSNRR